ncbi:DUF2877 domain-containing protein [Virgibacillus halodenitrificans]|nr:DUF2877 domain-containing protein [Virgibacillus halodenitrificans]
MVMAASPTCQIKQMDRHLLEWLRHKRNGEHIGVVHSVFDKVINFISNDKQILFSLAKDEVVQSPRMMKTSQDDSFSAMKVTLHRGDDIYFIGDDCLELNGWKWRFSDIAIWNRDIASLSQTSSEISSAKLKVINDFILKNGAREGIFAAWKSYNDPSWEVPKATKKNIYFTPFLTGIKETEQEIKEQKLEAFMEKLVGLGIGLTPSGDDFLTGLLATWKHTEFPLYKEFATSQMPTLQKLQGRTTDVSYFMLKHCLNGDVNEALLDLLGSVNAEPSHMSKLLAIGSTSGTDMLAGVSFAYQQLLNYEEEIQWHQK